MDKITIYYKFPSFNQYTSACRSNKYIGASMKKKIQNDIRTYISELPAYDKPIKVKFIWVENNKRRDLDNICFAKKFILDALVENHKLKDDNRKCVTGFIDEFEYDKESKVVLEIYEEDSI